MEAQAEMKVEQDDIKDKLAVITETLAELKET